MNITIIGGGIAGLTTAIALQQAGYSYQIFEAADSIKAIGAGLGLGANAIQAFNRLGLDKEVIALGRELPSFTIYDQQGVAITKTNNEAIRKKYGVNNFTIHRAALYELLLSKIDRSALFTGKRIIDFEYTDTYNLKFEDGSIRQAGAVIVADGIHSPIRKKLLPKSLPRYAGYTCWRAVIDNSSLQLTETSETWGTNGRFGIVPLAGNKIYWFACVNAAANDPAIKNFRVKDIQERFKNYHAPIPAILQHTTDDLLIWNDIIDIAPVNKYAYGKMLLIGDAGHATTPNLGQGACQAIEDAVVLGDELKHNLSIETAFSQFEKRRLKRTHYIINTSRAIGRVAQVENKLMSAARNSLFRMIPASFNEKQLDKLYRVDF